MKGKSSMLSICNFPIQSTGSEILRATVIDLANAGFQLLATVHDSVIVEVDSKDWEQEEIRLKAVMKSTTQQLLGGKEILVETKIIHPGERYHDERGKDMWDFLEKRLRLNKGTPMSNQVSPNGIPGPLFIDINNSSIVKGSNGEPDAVIYQSPFIQS